MNIKPNLVDKKLFQVPKSLPSKPIPLSFYFNIILILVLIIGGCLLYYKYTTKKDNDIILQNKLISLNQRINQQLKNIE